MGSGIGNVSQNISHGLDHRCIEWHLYIKKCRLHSTSIWTIDGPVYFTPAQTSFLGVFKLAKHTKSKYYHFINNTGNERRYTFTYSVHTTAESN